MREDDRSALLAVSGAFCMALTYLVPVYSVWKPFVFMGFRKDQNNGGCVSDEQLGDTPSLWCDQQSPSSREWT